MKLSKTAEEVPSTRGVLLVDRESDAVERPLRVPVSRGVLEM
jgi:hypothetical protein